MRKSISRWNVAASLSLYLSPHLGVSTLSIFKKTRKYGTILLCVWLIASGLNSLLGPNIPHVGEVLAVLAIAAGVLILIDR